MFVGSKQLEQEHSRKVKEGYNCNSRLEKGDRKNMGSNTEYCVLNSYTGSYISYNLCCHCMVSRAQENYFQVSKGSSTVGCYRRRH